MFYLITLGIIPGSDTAAHTQRPQGNDAGVFNPPFHG